MRVRCVVRSSRQPSPGNLDNQETATTVRETVSTIRSVRWSRVSAVRRSQNLRPGCWEANAMYGRTPQSQTGSCKVLDKLPFAQVGKGLPGWANIAPRITNPTTPSDRLKARVESLALVAWELYVRTLMLDKVECSFGLIFLWFKLVLIGLEFMVEAHRSLRMRGTGTHLLCLAGLLLQPSIPSTCQARCYCHGINLSMRSTVDLPSRTSECQTNLNDSFNAPVLSMLEALRYNIAAL